MRKGFNAALPQRCCGKCSKTIRMRGEPNTVLCTANLDVVEAEGEVVCEHYVERADSAPQQLIKRS